MTGVDRCALFVDAGYVLADGAMAVHGTRRRESVSWDYAGLTRFLAGLASERSGLPLLRCYWYEATVEGRRSAEHDTLADLPGVKLRVAKMRPGRREGVESEIHRDLTALARNKAVSDAMVVSAEEDLARVVADVQDLGMRVTLLHIAVEGNGTVPRALRQECDDIAEISSAHLRPYVELISGAEPPRQDEQDGAPLIVFRPTASGHDQAAGTTPYPPAPQETGNGYQASPAPQDAQPDPRGAQPGQQEAHPVQQNWPPFRDDARPAPQEPVQQEVAAEEDQAASPEPAEYLGAPPGLAVVQQEQGEVQPSPEQEYATGADWPGGPQFTPRPDVYGAPVAVPAPPAEQPAPQSAPLPAARTRATDHSGYQPGAIRLQPPDPMTREPLPGEPGDGLQPVPVASTSAQVRRLPTRGTGQPAWPLATAAQPMPALPPRAQPPQAQPGIAQPAAGPLAPPQPEVGQPTASQPPSGQPPMGHPGNGQQVAPVMPIAPDGGYAAARNGSYTGPRPVVPPGPGGSGGTSPAPWAQPASSDPTGLAGQPPANPAGPVPPGAQQAGLGVGQLGPGFAEPGLPTPPPNPAGAVNGMPNAYGQPTGGLGVPGSPPGPVGPLGPVGPAYAAAPPGVSLADAVQSAHEEGQQFGESVARDAPTLWLEAVLARKPRMPSDLEAQLLQGSALPIDFLLHDEVRHALRRGFWDALERARR